MKPIAVIQSSRYVEHVKRSSAMGHGRLYSPKRGGDGTKTKPCLMLIPKTRREIWLNRVRIWLPPLFIVAALALRPPAWNLWGAPLVALGETLRTWAAGHLLKDEQLTVGGPYAHVRNPLYLGSLLSGLGFLVIVGDWRVALAFTAVALMVYLPTVLQEEDYLRRMHGEAFELYRRRVPALMPRLRPVSLGELNGRRQMAGSSGPPPWSRCDPGASELPLGCLRQGGFEWRRVWLNKEHRTWMALMAAFGLMWLRTWWS